MIKTLFKLVFAALIANAAWRVGSEYITEFKFTDAVREAAVYEGRGDFDLRQHVAALASQFDVPVDADELKIERVKEHVRIEGEYDKPIEVVPGYEQPWHFTWNVDADVVQPKPNVGEEPGTVDGR